MQISSTRLLQFSQQFKKFYTHQFLPLLKESGLSMREMDVLLFLANNPNFDTARDITEFRGLSKSQVSQAVDLLVAEGLLLRTPDTDDRRVVHLSVTPDGEPLARKAQGIQKLCGELLFTGLTSEQEQLLHTALETVLDNTSRLAEEVTP